MFTSMVVSKTGALYTLTYITAKEKSQKNMSDGLQICFLQDSVQNEVAHTPIFLHIKSYITLFNYKRIDLVALSLSWSKDQSPI